MSYSALEAVVYCKDCNYVCMCDSTDLFPDMPVYAECTLTDEVHDPNWFCADGVKGEEEKPVNAKQAAKAASKRIEQLEDFNRRAASEIKGLNQAIDSIIAGGSPCDWCEEQTECQLQAKADGKGCELWWLKEGAYAEEDSGDDSSDSPVLGALPG